MTPQQVPQWHPTPASRRRTKPSERAIGRMRTVFGRRAPIPSPWKPIFRTSALVRVCSCANPASPASAAGACSAFPGHARGRVGVECDVCPRQLTAVECRPPPGASALAASGRGSRPRWLRFTRGHHQGLGAVLARPSPVLHLYDQLARLADLIAIF
jgi:hypothetical protein